MIPLKALTYAAAFGAGLLVAGVTQDWRYGEVVANAERDVSAAAAAASAAHSEAMRLVLAEQALSSNKMSESDKAATEVISDVQEETNRLRDCIDSGRGCGLRVKVVRSPAATCMQEADPTTSVGDQGGEWAELSPDARRNTYALRTQLAVTQEALRVCVNNYPQ